MISPKILWSLLFIFAGSVLLAQRPLILPAENSPAEVNILRNTHLVTLRAFEQNMNTRVDPPRALFTGGTENATIMVGYNGFPPSAQNAFQYAVNIWQTQITSAVPIRVTANWISLDPGVLGSAGATDFRRNFPGAPQQDTWYCVALAENWPATR